MSNPQLQSGYVQITGKGTKSLNIDATVPWTERDDLGNTVATAGDLAGIGPITVNSKVVFADGTEVQIAGVISSPKIIAVAKNKTTVTAVGQSIVDTAFNVWALNAAGQITVNGVADTTTSNVVELAFVNSVVWQLNKAGLWYSWSGTAWSAGVSTNPITGVATVTPPPVTTPPVTPAPPATTPPAGATVISIATKTLSSVLKQGANWGGQNFYDSAQSQANLLWQGPSFAPMTRRPMLVAASGTTTSFIDNYPWSETPANYWKGATATILTGPNAGKQLTITGSSTVYNANGGPGTTYTFFPAVSPALTNERIQLDFVPNPATSLPGHPYIPGWQWGFSGSASIVQGDVPASSWDTWALRVDASASTFSMGAYWDSANGQRFLTMSGAHSFTFWYKVVSGAPKISVQVSREGYAAYCNQSVAISGASWQQGTISFTANETAATKPGTCNFTMTVTGGVVMFDDVWLGANQDIGFTLRAAYRTKLASMNLGILRFWDGQGRRFADWVKPMQYRPPHNAGVLIIDGGGGLTETQANVSSLSLPDAVSVAVAAGVKKIHFVFDVGWGVTEFSAFMQWAEGTGTDQWSALRIKAGIAQPLSQLFTEVHFSLGNETWGTGEGENDPDFWTTVSNSPYMTRVKALQTAIHALPQWKAGVYYLVACVQSGDTSRIAAFSTVDGTEAMEYYMNGPTDNGLVGTTVDAMMDSMLLEVQDRVTNPKNPHYSQHQYYAQAKIPQPFVYEWNVAPYTSSMTQAMTTLTASLWAGLMNLSLMIEESKLWGIEYWMLFAMPQFAMQANGLGAGVTQPMWGGWRDVEGTYGSLDRPTLLQLQLFNSVAQLGQRVATSTTNARKNTAGYSESTFDCFTDGNGNYGLILVNNDRVNAQVFSFSGLTPKGTMSTLTLGSANPTDHNENGLVVGLTKGTLPAASSIAVPAHAAIAVTFSA